MMVTLAAVDIGAQSGRVAVGEFDGERLAVHEVHRFDNGPIDDGGRLRWDIRRIFDDVIEGLGRAGQARGQVDSVGVDSWAVDFGLLDRSGALIENPTHYRDPRRAGAVEAVLDQIPAPTLYDRTGIQLMPINTVFELAAMAAEGDPALARAETLLLVPDLLQHWLCGARVTEFTNATTTQCIDATTGRWSPDILSRLDIPDRLFTEIVPSCTALGPVRAPVAERTGLAAATVVAVATHDTGSAVAAIPLAGPRSAYISAGTWSLVGVELAAPRIDAATYAANLTNEGGIAGTFRLLRNVTGLWLLHECRSAWEEQGDTWDYDALVALADTAPPLGSFVDPDDPRFTSPGDMPRRIRDFCTDTRQPSPTEPGAVVRCILESLALKHAQTLDLLSEATGTAIDEVHIVGGGSRNERLCRFTADAAGIPVLAGPQEATVVGNLLGQTMALGEVSSLGEARDVVRRSFVPKIYEPSSSSQWREAVARFAELVTHGQLQRQA